MTDRCDAFEAVERLQQGVALDPDIFTDAPAKVSQPFQRDQLSVVNENETTICNEPFEAGQGLKVLNVRALLDYKGFITLRDAAQSRKSIELTLGCDECYWPAVAVAAAVCGKDSVNA